MDDEQKEGIFEQMSQLFIDTYEELVAAMEVMKLVGINPGNRKERVNELQMRYTEIIEKYQNNMFEQPAQEGIQGMNNETLYIVDIDGIVANSTKRFEKARKDDGKTDWSIAFEPSNVELDTLIEGADNIIKQLRGDVVYLTSRPESMWQATHAWLDLHGLAKPGIICKPESKKYTKTIKWKADEVQECAQRYQHVVFIDDEESNRFEVMKLALGNVDCYESLAQALEAIGDQDIEEQVDHNEISERQDAYYMARPEVNPEADIIMQNIDPAVRNTYEEEIANPSPRRQKDDGGPAIIL